LKSGPLSTTTTTNTKTQLHGPTNNGAYKFRASNSPTCATEQTGVYCLIHSPKRVCPRSALPQGSCTVTLKRPVHLRTVFRQPFCSANECSFQQAVFSTSPPIIFRPTSVRIRRTGHNGRVSPQPSPSTLVAIRHSFFVSPPPHLTPAVRACTSPLGQFFDPALLGSRKAPCIQFQWQYVTSPLINAVPPPPTTGNRQYNLSTV